LNITCLIFLNTIDDGSEINIKILTIIVHKKRLLQMKRLLSILLLSCFALAAFSQPKKDGVAPEVSLPTPDSKIINLSELKGKVVVLDFWASWCPPCRENNPHLAKLYKKYHDKGFEILSVSLDTSATAWKQAIAEDKMEWLQVNDDKGPLAPTPIAYNVGGIPSMYLIDKKGIIREINLFGWQLESEVKSLLKK
jgi:thiol-disulfide isomerase/thioredoxin